MKLFEIVRERQWIPITGYLIYVAALTAGYYYNLTFVQVGLTDLGRRTLGMPPEDVSTVMAVLALLTLVAVVSGILMDRCRWCTDLYVKFRLLFPIILVQLLLTIAVPFVSTVKAFATDSAAHVEARDNGA